MDHLKKKYTKKYIKKKTKKYAKRYVNRYFETNYSDFEQCSFDEMKVGDIVSSWTMTNSQKYLFKEGFEEYNMEKKGILIKKNNDNPELSEIFQYDSKTDTFKVTNLYRDPGTSGMYGFKRKFNLGQNKPILIRKLPPK
jgi:hypothetical protein